MAKTIPCTPKVFDAIAVCGEFFPAIDTASPVMAVSTAPGWCRFISFDGALVIIDDEGAPHILLDDTAGIEGGLIGIIGRLDELGIAWELKSNEEEGANDN